MYESFYGLKEKPFNLTPDPDYLYMSQTHENVLTHLEYAITENKGFVVITGEIGAGKTTLINFLLNKIQQSVHVGLINNPAMSPNQLIKMMCQEFELRVSGANKASMLDAFYRFLLKEYSEKRRVVLIIDEAQNLSVKTIEEIRLLSNLEAEKDHLIQIILAGQPELENKLQKKVLRQFAQRVTVSCHLAGLSEAEVLEYVRHRLMVAGTDNLDIFNRGAIEAVHKHSDGIPRIINIICDAALVFGYADGLELIDENVIQEVVHSRKFGGIVKEVEDAREQKRRKSEDMKISRKLSKRLQAVEKRIDQIESALASSEKLILAMGERDGRLNTITLELLKMLKESMEGRMEVVLKVQQLKEQMESGTRRPSRFFPLSRKR
jgi:general secretion pathway protein A